METLLNKGDARKCDQNSEAKGRTCYLPHHGIYHQSKGKLIVIFDCGAKFNGVSLNEKLLQGPDLTNSLVGVLIRFRMHPIAIMADIEAMFYQVQVPPEQRSFLRFLWWKDGMFDQEPDTFEMNVHIFGVISSPSCSNFALTQAAYSLRKNFYVDDWLKSVEDDDQAISLLIRLQDMCKDGGFNLTKVVSNSEKVISSVPVEKGAPSIQEFELLKKLPIERALGVQWSVENDTFQLRIIMDHLRGGISYHVSALSMTHLD